MTTVVFSMLKVINVLNFFPRKWPLITQISWFSLKHIRCDPEFYTDSLSSTGTPCLSLLAIHTNPCVLSEDLFWEWLKYLCRAIIDYYAFHHLIPPVNTHTTRLPPHPPSRPSDTATDGFLFRYRVSKQILCHRKRLPVANACRRNRDGPCRE